jgi:pilus assembly protein Flp/PilA
MTLILWKLYAGFQNLINREEGQDLVEYALAVALIALGATVGMKALATGINTAFGNLANTLSTTA